MVAADMGICILPEYSATVPGVTIRPVVAPEVARDVALVTMAGRQPSMPLAAFTNAVRRYRWPEQWAAAE
jgi:DNA-binding transcriptional LysR family regulator